MPPTFQISAIHLRVSDLRRSVDFYSRRLGFTLVRTSENQAELGTGANGAPILMLNEQPHAARPQPESAGLFHAAVLFPQRSALAAWLQFAAATSIDFEGFSDHGVSEAIYLSDPDGNGLEFYADRPKSEWPFADGELAMMTRPLDVHGLLATAASAADAPLAGASWGHLHLRVTNLDRSEKFYRETFGMEVTQRSYPGARFMSVGGYHHHLGLNSWGAPRLAQSPSALGLAEAVVAQAGVSAEARVVDPDGIPLRIQPALVPA
jgi:catechol 2,3-dioxygenase